MVEALGLTLKEFVFYLLNFIILIGILGKFLYRPFINMLETRRQTIKEAFDSAEATNKRADEKLAKYEKRIANVEEEGREIIREATDKAKAKAAGIIDEANAQADDIVKKARLEMEREKESALADMRDQISELALMMAERIMEKEIEVNGQEQILDQVMEEVGTSKWQN